MRSLHSSFIKRRRDLLHWDLLWHVHLRQDWAWQEGDLRGYCHLSICSIFSIFALFVQVTLEGQLGLIGGTMGLLTGFSILSGVEIFYYLARLLVSLWGKRICSRKVKESSQPRLWAKAANYDLPSHTDWIFLCLMLSFDLDVKHKIKIVNYSCLKSRNVVHRTSFSFELSYRISLILGSWVNCTFISTKRKLKWL